jgi:hypothetical protein
MLGELDHLDGRIRRMRFTLDPHGVGQAGTGDRGTARRGAAGALSGRDAAVGRRVARLAAVGGGPGLLPLRDPLLPTPP